jgi:hypothetical protein
LVLGRLSLAQKPESLSDMMQPSFDLICAQPVRLPATLPRILRETGNAAV